jgi:hypothetical protein
MHQSWGVPARGLNRMIIGQPRCRRCGATMRLAWVEPLSTGRRQFTFACHCGHQLVIHAMLDQVVMAPARDATAERRQ